MNRLMGSAVVMSALVLTLSACQKQEGPAEKAGKEIDQASEKAAEQLKEAADKLGQQLEKAGEKMQDASKDKDR
ncbi:hypothetical protein [Malikia spinosa]|nr:hypothetical protein [Malikia spinosa]